MKKSYIPFFILPLILSFVAFFFLTSQKTELIQAQTTTLSPVTLCVNCAMYEIGNRLKNKDLTDSYLPNATFGGIGNTDMSGVVLNGAFLDGGGIGGGNVVLNDAKFKNASLKGFNLATGHGTNVNFKNAILTQASFSDTSFHSANFTNAKIDGTVFANSDLTDSNMTGVDATGVDFARFSNTILTNVNFTNANLTGAIDMSIANVTGATWSNTICPDSTNSDNNGGTCVGHF